MSAASLARGIHRANMRTDAAAKAGRWWAVFGWSVVWVVLTLRLERRMRGCLEAELLLTSDKGLLRARIVGGVASVGFARELHAAEGQP